LIAVFRRNHFFTQLLLLPYVFIVRIFSLIEPVSYAASSGGNEFQQAIYSILPDALMQNIVSNLLIYIQALLVNAIAVKHRLIRENTLIPANLYVLFVSVLPQNAVLAPAIVANTFIALAVFLIYSTYKAPIVTMPVYMAGFYLSLASIFYFPYLIFCIWGFLGIVQLRKFRFLEIIQFLCGYVTPVFLLATYRIWNGSKLIDVAGLRKMFGMSVQFQNFELNFSIAGLFLVLLLTIMILFRYDSITGKKNIQLQKKYNIQYLALLFAFLSYFLLFSNGWEPVLTLSVPLAFLGGVLVSDSSSRLVYEFIHLVFLASALSPGFL